MLYTILQIIAFQTLFLLVYDLFLKRETFFNHNRAYLLITSLCSLILPFIKLPELQKIAVKDAIIHLPEVFIGTKTPTTLDIQIAEQAGIILEQPQTPIWQLVLFSGILFATCIFLFKILKLYWLKFNNPKHWQGNILIVKLIESSAAFSFFNTIFLGERIPETQKPTIYKHELVHIKEHHTVDLLFFELLRIVFWFNPLIYIYQNRIKELHEYIADAKAVKQNGKSAYYQSLLNHVFDVHNVSFTNTFFKKSLIKKRIAMLQKSKSKQLNLIKYALLIPLIFTMLIYTSTEVRAQQKVESQEEIVNQELTDEELVEKYYKEFVNMKIDNSNFRAFTDSIMLNRNITYIESRKQYLRMIAFGKYLMQSTLEKKSEQGTLTDADVNRVEEMQNRKYKSYAEYLEWKKTDEAIEQWELSTQDGVLKLVVKDIRNYTKKEQKRYDALKRQLLDDTYFKKLVVTDGKTTTVLDSPNDPHPDAKETLTIVESMEIPFNVIDEVPTLQSCKDLSTNEDRKKCINEFINRHINKNFNIGLADSIKVAGRQRIFVQFKIDKEGKVKGIKARAAHPDLEEEAKRVIGTLPQFTPGRQDGKLVTVPYSIPIVFQVASKNDSIKKQKQEKLIKYLKSEINKQESQNRIVPFVAVEIAPIHPDCTSITLEEERKKCTSKAVTMLVNKSFNTKMADSLNIYGRQRINAQFKINTEGKVFDIKARASHPEFEKETIRVLQMLPNFIPGNEKGEAVIVPYSLPIIFQNVKPKKN